MSTEQQPPSFPQLGFQVMPDGAVFVIQLGNGVSINQVVNAETMQQICKAWLESRKALMQQQQLVADVLRSKN
jgi:hypothetical protein